MMKKKELAAYLLIFLLLVLSSYSPSCPAYESYTDSDAAQDIVSDNTSSSSSLPMDRQRHRRSFTQFLVNSIFATVVLYYLIKMLIDVCGPVIWEIVGNVSIIKLEVGFPLADPDLIDENDIRCVKNKVPGRTGRESRVKCLLSRAVPFLQDNADSVSWAVCSVVQTLKFAEWKKKRYEWTEEHIRPGQGGENILVTLLIVAKGKQHKLPTAGGDPHQDMLRMALQQIALIDPSSIMDLAVIRTYAGNHSV